MARIILVSLFGLCIGSFLNVIISRNDWHKSRSRCDSCKNTLKWYSLIPIVSYIIQGGRCIICKEKIPIIHLYAEAIMGIGFFVIAYVNSNTTVFNMFVMAITIVTLGFCAISDKAYGIIYTLVTDLVSLFVAMLTIFYYLDNMIYDRLMKHLFIYLLIILICILCAKIDKEKHLGYGDYHLFCLIALSLSFMNVFLAVFIGSVVGLILTLPKYFCKREPKSSEIAFAPLLYYGYLAVVLYNFGGM